MHRWVWKRIEDKLAAMLCPPVGVQVHDRRDTSCVLAEVCVVMHGKARAATCTSIHAIAVWLAKVDIAINC